MRKPLNVSIRERRLLQISGVLLVVTALVWWGIVLNPLLTEAKRKKAKAKPVMVYVRVPPETIAAQWAEVQRMRELMRPWAEKHKDLLRKMKSGDKAAFDQAYKAIPIHMDPTIIGFSSEDNLYTWNCHVGERFPVNPKTSKIAQSRDQSSIDISEALLKGNRQKYADIELSDAVMGGQYQFVLWASGRITKAYTVDPCHYLDCFTERRQEEIVPPYEFLNEPEQ